VLEAGGYVQVLWNGVFVLDVRPEFSYSYTYRTSRSLRSGTIGWGLWVGLRRRIFSLIILRCSFFDYMHFTGRLGVVMAFVIQ